MASSNKAIFLANGTPNCPLEIKERPLTLPGPQELVVKNRFVAINPVDAYKQLLGEALLPYVAWPHVPGSDLAGEVVHVGSAGSRFAVGDRVIPYAAGTLPFGNRPAEGAFQRYAAAIASALKRKELAGALAVNPGGLDICADVLRAALGSSPTLVRRPLMDTRRTSDQSSLRLATLPSLKALSPTSFATLCPKLLHQASSSPSQSRGSWAAELESIQKAFGLRLRGVSAQKILVALD
ncbi:zinc-binding oxidoreductase CipB [Ophiocordyceps sinensis CO18]|uniref:Zinc-binding oxidoreductase CipB n=1 Tax=Ophiocordyceps sinensis (strain Co18 / CGMCC 3.14243) TaxID=911162 RepID=T5A6E6_OPHSC|nr:zinc-binding oxidoreductase CipB [Ophiocordyceps sinensis CO18]